MADDLDFQGLLAFVRKEIDGYDYQAVIGDGAGLVGVLLSQEAVNADLARFREALVDDPYWIEFSRRDTFDEVSNKTPIVERCVVVTDDSDSYLLAYQPDRREFLLVDRGEDGYHSIGISGDAVGCYMAM